MKTNFKMLRENLKTKKKKKEEEEERANFNIGITNYIIGWNSQLDWRNTQVPLKKRKIKIIIIKKKGLNHFVKPPYGWSATFSHPTTSGCNHIGGGATTLFRWESVVVAHSQWLVRGGMTIFQWESRQLHTFNGALNHCFEISIGKEWQWPMLMLLVLPI
jgi:hypothetical protein